MSRSTWTLGPYTVEEREGTFYVYAGPGRLLYQGDGLGLAIYMRNRGYELEVKP